LTKCKVDQYVGQRVSSVCRLLFVRFLLLQSGHDSCTKQTEAGGLDKRMIRPIARSILKAVIGLVWDRVSFASRTSDWQVGHGHYSLSDRSSSMSVIRRYDGNT